MPRQSSEASTTQQPIPQDDFEYRFSEIEFRAFRAYCMNYKESGRYDCWVSILDSIRGIFALLAVLTAGVATYMVYTQESSWSYFAVSIPPALFSGMAEIAARGNNKWLPVSLATRAQKHVDAGAEWSEIHRQAKLYRQNIQRMKRDHQEAAIQNDDQTKLYFALLEKSKKASMCTVIRAKVYKEFDDIKKVTKKDETMRQQAMKYMDYIKKPGTLSVPPAAASGASNDKMGRFTWGDSTCLCCQSLFHSGIQMQSTSSCAADIQETLV